VVLETQSTETGVKEFVVAATSVFRGEDLAVRGAVSYQTILCQTYASDAIDLAQVYIFEIVEVVPESNVHQRQYRLRLHVRDEAKGPVTAVCGINGYLVSSMGQKVGSVSFIIPPS
jgi:cleavage and polyadenylation specificity factor subunit 1